MKNSRLSGLIVLVIAILLVGGLTWYELTQNGPKESVAFGPAVSSDESVPPGDQPIIPPASLTEGQPAPAAGGAPAAAPTAPAASDTGMAAAPANPPGPAAAEQPTAEAPAAGAATPAPDSQIAAQPATEAPAAVAPTAAAPAAEASAAPDAAPAATTPQPATGQQIATAEPPPAAAAPGATAMVAPASVVPTFDVVRVEPTGETVVAGLAAPESKVEVLDGAAAVATATANDRGEWAMALDNALKPGTHDLAVRTTSKDGAVSMLSDQRVAVQVPEPGSKDVLVVMNSPDQPSRVLALPKAKEPAAGGEQQVAAAEQPPAGGTPAAAPAEPETPKAGGETAALAPQTGTAAATSPAASATPEPAAGTAPAASATPEPVAGASAPAQKPPEPATAEKAPPPAEPAPPAPEVAVSAVEADTAGTLFVAGTATTDQTVRVYLNDQPLGEAKPSPSGTWLVEVHHEVAPGSYSVRADQVSTADGTVVARAEVPFERKIEVASLKASGDTGAAAGAKVSGQLPDVQTVIIKRGDNLWSIARSNWGQGIRWSTLYQANKDQIRNPHWIYPGQVFVMPVSPEVAKD